jgi:hypothetical protein
MARGRCHLMSYMLVPLAPRKGAGMWHQISLGVRPVLERPSDLEGEDLSSSKEAQTYLTQLRRVFGQEPPSARLIIDENSAQVICEYQEGVIIGRYYAYLCEMRPPLRWDTTARSELTDTRVP